MTKIISQIAIESRQYWIAEIQKLSDNLGNDSDRLEKELEQEIKEQGFDLLINHLRLCGNIPECYEQDTSEEKLYSKYTDILLSLAYKYLGFKSIVLGEQTDAADVEVFARNYSFVADAKAFRLSRTEKSRKDFKVNAMDSWKRGKPYAMIVCPIYQLPRFSSQIYHQATTKNVCVFTYSHLSLLLSFAEYHGKNKAQKLLENIFSVILALNPSKSATDYWLAVNKTILSYSKNIEKLWETEKLAAMETIAVAKDEALTFLAQEREKIMRMSHQEALNELIKVHTIDSRMTTIQSLSDNGLFSIQ